METATITSATTTTFDVPAGEHVFRINGTWGGTSANVRHADSGISFEGLGAITADPTKHYVLKTGGESIEVVTTGGSGISLTASVGTCSPRRV